MTLIIKLEPDIEEVVVTGSAAQGLSPEQFVGQIIKNYASAEVKHGDSESGKTLVDVFAPLQGLGLDFGRNPSAGRPVNV